MIWQQLRGRSPAEYTGMIAIGLVVVAAWVYSITLEYSFFAAVTPGTNPMFPYLGLAFTGIGLALWGIGFACALKSFTQVMTMIMMLASGGTAVYIATVQFQAQGDAHYNIALDPANYEKALTITGVMLLLNVAMLVLKVIVWRFSQPGTGFFERPHVYAPDQQQPQPRYVEAQVQPKEERSLEQRATRQLPPARSSQGGFWQGVTSLFQKQSPTEEQQFETEDERDEWLAEIELKRERDMAEAQQRKEAAKQRVLARQSQQSAPETSVQQSEPVDRKAEAEQQSKNR